MNSLTLFLGSLFLLSQAGAIQAQQSPDPDQIFFMRLAALALPHSARSMCADAPASVREKLEGNLKLKELDKLGANYLCQDDLCAKVSGAPAGKPDLSLISILLAKFRSEQAEAHKMFSPELRMENCTKFILRIEQVISTAPEQIFLEMSDIETRMP